MTRRLIPLIERRSRPVRLRREEAIFLLTHARHLIEVAPTLEHRVYNLTPRGFVGFFDGPMNRYAIEPKIPWPNLRMLLGFPTQPGGNATEPPGGLLAVLADEFASRLEAVNRVGLVAGYGEVSNVSPFLRGKLRTAEQLRSAAAGAFPDRFHIDEPVFDLHTPWHRILKATAAVLLSNFELPGGVLQRVKVAIEPLDVVPSQPATEADFTATIAEPRATGYLPLLDVCRLILDGVTCADPLGMKLNAFLVDLGRMFERYLISALQQELGQHTEWRVEAHPPFMIGPTELQPDILIRYRGAPWAVLDAKWKRSKHEAADLHQVLAYASITGAKQVALVYPSRRDERIRYTTPGGLVQVSLYRLRVVGTREELAQSVAALARTVRKG